MGGDSFSSGKMSRHRCDRQNVIQRKRTIRLPPITVCFQAPFVPIDIHHTDRTPASLSILLQIDDLHCLLLGCVPSQLLNHQAVTTTKCVFMLLRSSYQKRTLVRKFPFTKEKETHKHIRVPIPEIVRSAEELTFSDD